MKGVEHGVLTGNIAFVKGLFCELHRFSDMVVVMTSPKESSTCWSFWMRTFDLNASHFPFLTPHRLDGLVVKKSFKTQKSQFGKFVQRPLLKPRWFPFNQRLRNGDRAVMVDDELMVGRDSDVKLNPIKQGECMSQAFEGVFGSRCPFLPPCHTMSCPWPVSKVVAAGRGKQTVGQENRPKA